MATNTASPYAPPAERGRPRRRCKLSPQPGALSGFPLAFANCSQSPSFVTSSASAATIGEDRENGRYYNCTCYACHDFPHQISSPIFAVVVVAASRAVHEERLRLPWSGVSLMVLQQELCTHNGASCTFYIKGDGSRGVTYRD